MWPFIMKVDITVVYCDVNLEHYMLLSQGFHIESCIFQDKNGYFSLYVVRFSVLGDPEPEKKEK